LSGSSPGPDNERLVAFAADHALGGLHHGVGSANLLTNKAVDMMDDGYSLVTQPVASSTRDAAQQIFEMNLCKYAINEQLSGFYDDAGSASTSEMSTSGSDGSYETSSSVWDRENPHDHA
jgi:hypothetical protein